MPATRTALASTWEVALIGRDICLYNLKPPTKTQPLVYMLTWTPPCGQESRLPTYPASQRCCWVIVLFTGLVAKSSAGPMEHPPPPPSSLDSDNGEKNKNRRLTYTRHTSNSTTQNLQHLASAGLENRTGASSSEHAPCAAPRWARGPLLTDNWLMVADWGGVRAVAWPMATGPCRQKTLEGCRAYSLHFAFCSEIFSNRAFPFSLVAMTITPNGLAID